MKLLALCHLFCCRACWLLYFISCNQGFSACQELFIEWEKKIAICSLASKASFKLSKWTTASLLPSDILLFDPHLHKNKSTFLDFIFLETWKQFPRHGHFHWEIIWSSPVKILHSYTVMAAGSQLPHMPPLSGLQCQRGHLLWVSPSLVQLTCTHRVGKFCWWWGHFSCLH